MRAPTTTLPFPSLPPAAVAPAEMDEPERPEPLVRVHTLSSEVEAGFLDAVLDAHDVPHAIERIGCAGYTALLELQSGFGAVLVPESEAGRAATLIAAALAEAEAGGDGEVDEEEADERA